MSELTDEQIIKVAQETATAEAGRDGYILPIHFARAVIAADRALRTPTIPEGYALVPIEPTSKMLEAAQLADGDHGDHEDWLGFQWEMGMDQVWSAMLEAAKDSQP